MTDVSAADVALVENGVHRDIASFARDMRPLAVAILVDSSAAVSSSYRLNVVDAVVGLVARLPEGARYAIWTTGDRPTKLVDYTDDRGAAGAALRRVAPQGGNYTLDALGGGLRATSTKLAREGDRRAVVAVTGHGAGVQLPRQAARGRGGRERAPTSSFRCRSTAAEGDFDTRTRPELHARAPGDGERRARPTRCCPTWRSTRRSRSCRRTSRPRIRLRYATLPDLKKRKLELSVARPGTRVVIPQLLARDEPAARAERRAPAARLHEDAKLASPSRSRLPLPRRRCRSARRRGRRPRCSAPGSRSST